MRTRATARLSSQRQPCAGRLSHATSGEQEHWSPLLGVGSLRGLVGGKLSLDPIFVAPLAAAFGCGLILGGLATALWRGSSRRFARRLMIEAETQRQAETEALLDGVKLAFGDIS